MKETILLHTALENLEKSTGIEAIWEETTDTNFDGQLQFDYEKNHFAFNVEIKKDIRNHQLEKIQQQAINNSPFMLCTNRIFPKIKEVLRQNGIAWLEANGNVYFKQHGQTIWIDTQKPYTTEKDKANRAFTKTGLKVVFHFLLDSQLINEKHRELARKTNTALGNINNVLKGLKEMGFIVDQDKQTKVLINKKELVAKWITAYQEVLKPTLLIGTFRFINQDDYINWQEIKLDTTNTHWGGEPAADILTGHLRPGKLTIYTDEPKTVLLKKYRLVPFEKGDILVYKKFWDEQPKEGNIVPILLIYADLIGEDEKRCLETAQLIYENWLNEQF
jgi:hypothetical protein